MPIEIRELVIRAYIEPEKSKASESGASSKEGASADSMADSIEQVMEMIKDKKER